MLKCRSSNAILICDFNTQSCDWHSCEMHALTNSYNGHILSILESSYVCLRIFVATWLFDSVSWFATKTTILCTFTVGIEGAHLNMKLNTSGLF